MIKGANLRKNKSKRGSSPDRIGWVGGELVSLNDAITGSVKRMRNKRRDGIYWSGCGCSEGKSEHYQTWGSYHSYTSLTTLSHWPESPEGDSPIGSRCVALRPMYPTAPFMGQGSVVCRSAAHFQSTQLGWEMNGCSLRANASCSAAHHIRSGTCAGDIDRPRCLQTLGLHYGPTCPNSSSRIGHFGWRNLCSQL